MQKTYSLPTEKSHQSLVQQIPITILAPPTQKHPLGQKRPEGLSEYFPHSPLHTSQKYIPSSSTSTDNSSRFKLKDYLFLAQTSSTKKATEKRIKMENKGHKQTNTASFSLCSEAAVGKTFKKEKYQIDNAEMMTILRNDLQLQLSEGLKEIGRLKESLSHTIKDLSKPSDFEMVTMYKLRATAKDKLKQAITQMKQMLSSVNDLKQSSASIEIELQQGQMGRDFAMIKEMISKKYLFEQDGNLDK